MWIDDINTIVRVVISDSLEPYKYTDNQINRITVISAFQVLRDYTFDSQYEMTLNTSGIVPDPSEDQAFINLVSKKSACNLLQAETKIAANESIRIQDALSEVDTGNRYNNVKDMADNICNDYKNSLLKDTLGQGGQAVFPPFQPYFQ